MKTKKECDSLKQNIFLCSPKKVNFPNFWAGKFGEIWLLCNYYLYYEIKVSNTLYRLSMLNKVSVFTYISCLVLKTAEFMSEFSRRTYMTNMLRKILNHLKNSRRNDPKISTKWSRIQQYYTLKQKKIHWNAEFAKKLKKHNRKIERKKKTTDLITSIVQKLSLAYCTVVYGLRWKFIQIYTDSTSSNFSHFSAAVAHLFMAGRHVCRRRQSVKKGHL